MVTSSLKHRASRAAQLAAVALVAIVVAACGSSSSSSYTPGGTTNSGASSTSSAGGGSATVIVGSVSGYGKALETGSGKPLYLLTADGTNSSKCDSACAKVWPPLTVSGSPTAGSGANSSMLSTFKRSDGTEQVSYDGHPLYTYTGPGGSGSGIASFGGIWYLVSADGKPIKHTSGNGY